MFGNLAKYIFIPITLMFSVEQSAAQLVPVLGAQRAGTAAAQFLKIGVGGRATAMGDAFIAAAESYLFIPPIFESNIQVL